MYLQKIEIHNFLSIEEASFSFKAGVHLVQGLNFDMSVDGTESNGSGKSAVTGEAVEWCLWGVLSRVSKPLADSVINKAEGKDCLVRTWFEAGGKNWEILRTRKHTEFGDCLRWWVDGVERTLQSLDDTKKDLEEKLPISHTVFRHAVQVGQGMPDRFLALSETDKQDLLCEILDLNMYDDALTVASNTVRVLETELASHEGVQSSAKSDLDRSEAALAQALVDIDTSKAAKDKAAVALYDRTAAIDKLKLELVQEEGTLRKAQQEQIDKNTEYQAWLPAAQAERCKANESVVEAMKKAEENLKQWEDGRSKLAESVHTTSLGVNTQKGKVQAIRSQIGELTRTGTSCPTCGQSLKNKEGIESRIAVLTGNLNDEEVVLAKADAVLSDRKKAQAEFEAQYLDAKGKWDAYIRDVRASVQAAFDGFDRKSSGFSNLITAIGNSIGLAQQRIDRNRSTISRLEDSTKDLHKEMTLSESSVARADERRKLAEKGLADAQVTYQGTTDRLDQTKKTLALWVYWRDSIPNLRAAAMEEILVYLNDRIGEYMSEFSSGVMGMEVYQVPYGKKSKIKVNLRTSGGTYEMSSGGERRRIDLAVYLALSDLLHVASGVQCNVLVADEIMDGLSPEGVKKFSEILRKKANNGMCVFVVSHNPAVRQIIEYDSIVTVEKRNDRAKLRLDVPAVQEGRRIVKTEGLVSV